MRERRICTTCDGSRAVYAGGDGYAVRVCPTCKGDGFELLELAKPLPVRGPQRQLVIWHQLDLDLGDTPEGERRER